MTPRPPRRASAICLIVALALVPIALGSTAGAASRKLTIVAAENFWGSIVKQLAGDRAAVTSIITNPATDPHDYEARPSDARTIASADYVVENGIGYDTWAQKLLDANPDAHPKVLNVGKVLGIAAGANPHQWYSPDSVHAFIQQVTRDLKSLDPSHSTYYDTQQAKYETTGLRRYDGLIATIRQKYAHTPVGATESIFTPLAQALALDLITPERFLDAVAEGTDPTAQDKATVDQQIAQHQIKVLVYNSQNATPDVKILIKEARTQHIPITTVTETLAPAGATFQSWQSKQLAALDAALAKATAG